MALQSSGTPIKFSQLMAELLLDSNTKTNFGSSGGSFRTLADLSTNSAIKFSNFYDQRHTKKQTIFNLTVKEKSSANYTLIGTDTCYGYVSGDSLAGVALTPSDRFLTDGVTVQDNGNSSTTPVSIFVYNETDNTIDFLVPNFYVKDSAAGHTAGNPVEFAEVRNNADTLIARYYGSNASNFSSAGVFSTWTWNNITQAVKDFFLDNEDSTIKLVLQHTQHQTANNHTPASDGTPL